MGAKSRCLSQVPHRALPTQQLLMEHAIKKIDALSDKVHDLRLSVADLSSQLANARAIIRALCLDAGIRVEDYRV